MRRRARGTPARPAGCGASSGHLLQAVGGDGPVADALQLATADELLDRPDHSVDLSVCVRRGYLDAEANLGLRDERVGGERHVDPACEEEAPDRLDVTVVAQRDLDDRIAGTVRRPYAEPRQR